MQVILVFQQCNYSWRTGLHRDAGDFEGGYGNLVVCEDENNPNKFRGCYLGFHYQYGVAVDVREGDFFSRMFTNGTQILNLNLGEKIVSLE